MTTSVLRAARVGDRLPRRLLAPATTRAIEAAAVLVPGPQRPRAYLDRLRDGEQDFAAWDGRLVVTGPDGTPVHRLLVVDRYNQVSAVHDEADADELPNVATLNAWFRFLATACPECGVIDDPLLGGPTP